MNNIQTLLVFAATIAMEVVRGNSKLTNEQIMAEILRREYDLHEHTGEISPDNTFQDAMVYIEERDIIYDVETTLPEDLHETVDEAGTCPHCNGTGRVDT